MSRSTKPRPPGPFALLGATNLFRPAEENPPADELFEAPRAAREEQARRRLVEAQAAFDRAQEDARAAPPESAVAALAALEAAKETLHRAGRELRRVRESAP